MKISVTSLEACFDTMKIWGCIVKKKKKPTQKPNICSNMPY